VKRIFALLMVCLFMVAVMAVTASTAFAQPNFNPGQKPQVCDAPGPNSNPNCNPG